MSKDGQGTRGRAQHYLPAGSDRQPTVVSKHIEKAVFRRPAMAKLYLRFEQNGQVLKEVPLSQAATTIGRLPDNSVQIDNLAVSGHHAKIGWENDHYFVEDLGSLNGTYVNNERVGKATLKHGDLLKIGTHVGEFKNESAVPNFAVAATPAPSTPKLEATM